MSRCGWCGTDPEYQRYHDEEWGRPVRDDYALFEKLCLEGFQAGLSWITILKKRDRFREVFHSFDPEKIAGMTNEDISRLMLDAGIIRNRLKIEATISNAQAWLKIMESGNNSFANFIWATVDGITKINQPKTKAEVPSKTKEAEILSKRLKKAGFRFVGPTICYAFMQSMGLVNDHIKGCWKAP
ncbi:MAG: DNA-3-methyladenine glycosylase I [Alphaproteobacteria bacterium]